VRLGTNVLATTFRHPALMAKMAGAAQELSGGRLVLGLGLATRPTSTPPSDWISSTESDV